MHLREGKKAVRAEAKCMVESFVGARAGKASVRDQINYFFKPMFKFSKWTEKSRLTGE